MSKVTIENLKINSTLLDFINKEAIPGTNIKVENFWRSFDEAVHELAPINKNLIDKNKKFKKKLMTGMLLKKIKVLNLKST